MTTFKDPAVQESLALCAIATLASVASVTRGVVPKQAGLENGATASTALTRSRAPSRAAVKRRSMQQVVGIPCRPHGPRPGSSTAVGSALPIELTAEVGTLARALLCAWDLSSSSLTSRGNAAFTAWVPRQSPEVAGPVADRGRRRPKVFVWRAAWRS